MALIIIQVIVFAGWISSSVWLFISCIKKIGISVDKYNITYPYKCKNCCNVIHYTYKEYVSISWGKMRNTKAVITGSSTINTYREYRLICPHCEKKTWQTPLSSELYIQDDRFKDEQKRIVIGMIIMIIAVGFFTVLFFTITDIM